jgi:hypothetical protein
MHRHDEQPLLSQVESAKPSDQANVRRSRLSDAQCRRESVWDSARSPLTDRAVIRFSRSPLLLYRGTSMRLRALLSSLVVAVVIAALLSAASACAADTLATIIKANESAVELIHTVQARFELTLSPRAVGPGASAPVKAFSFEWSADFVRGRNRIRDVNHLAKADALGPKGISDLVIVGTSYRLLENWDPASPQTLGPYRTGTVNADVGVVADAIPGGYDPRSSLLWTVDSAATSLRKSVEKSEKSRILPPEFIQGQKCVVVEIPSTRTTQCSYKVFIDPALNYMIRRIEGTTQPIKVNGRAEPVIVSARAEIPSFIAFPGGVYFPESLEVDRSDSKMIDRTTFKDVRVNEDLPNDAFDLQFPAWCRVRDMSSRETFIADGNGGKLASFSKPEEMAAWIVANYGPEEPEGSGFLRAALIIVNVLLITGLIVYFVRRRRAAHRG